jgi:hypothetical protein
MKYRNKPVVIEAFKWTGDMDQEEDPEWIIKAIREGVVKFIPNYSTARNGERNLVIHTLEGNMIASRGDYIIQGVNGEIYPCKPDIFEKTYELVG